MYKRFFRSILKIKPSFLPCLVGSIRFASRRMRHGKSQQANGSVDGIIDASQQFFGQRKNLVLGFENIRNGLTASDLREIKELHLQPERSMRSASSITV